MLVLLISGVSDCPDMTLSLLTLSRGMISMQASIAAYVNGKPLLLNLSEASCATCPPWLLAPAQ